jgi:hypothetical protein
VVKNLHPKNGSNFIEPTAGGGQVADVTSWHIDCTSEAPTEDRAAMRHEARSGATTAGAGGTAAALFKEDRPRAIDRYIDYFGDGSIGHRDVCGEALLGALADERPARAS